jgi:hypothetical protein
MAGISGVIESLGDRGKVEALHRSKVVMEVIWSAIIFGDN